MQMDLREKTLVTSKWMEWILRLRWPILILFTLPVLHILQSKEGTLLSSLLGNIRTQGIFPFASGNAALASPWFDLSAWFAVVPWLVWLLVLSIRYSPRILAFFGLSLVLNLGTSYLEYLPWLSIAGGCFFASYAVARLWTPLALIFAQIFSIILFSSLYQTVFEVLRMTSIQWFPYLVVGLAAFQALLWDLLFLRLRGWHKGQLRRESLVKSYQKLSPALAYACLGALGGLLCYNAVPSGGGVFWIWATAVLVVLSVIYIAVLLPAWLSTIPLADRTKA